MYVGRLVVVGPGIGAYRVSSRSFPDRRIAAAGDGSLRVVPTADAAETDNPYVSYTCLRTVDDNAVLGNGSHVDPIADKLDLGYPARDALCLGLLALDFERDDYDTPRIAGVVGDDAATVGTIRRDGIVVEAVDEPTLVATYELDDPRPTGFDATSAGEAAAEAYGLDFEHPVCAAGVAVDRDGIETAVQNGPGG